MKLFVDYWLLLTHYMLPNKCLVGWTYFPIISHKYGAGNVLLSTVYVVVPMSFYCIFPIAIALDHSESSQQQFQVARVLVALLNLVDHGKPRQLREIMTASNVGLGLSLQYWNSVSSSSSRSFLTLNHFQIVTAAAIATPTRHIWITLFFQVILSI